MRGVIPVTPTNQNLTIFQDEIGKMFWGWKKSLNNSPKTPPIKAGER